RGDGGGRGAGRLVEPGQFAGDGEAFVGVVGEGGAGEAARQGGGGLVEAAALFEVAGEGLPGGGVVGVAAHDFLGGPDGVVGPAEGVQERHEQLARGGGVGVEA